MSIVSWASHKYHSLYSWSIKKTLQASIIFKNEVSQPTKIIGLIILFLFNLDAILHRRWDALTGMFSLIPFAIYIIIYWISLEVLENFVKNTGGKFVNFLGDHFDLNDKCLKIKTEFGNEPDFEFVKEESKVDAAVNINTKAYENTSWYVLPDEKRKQFLSHLENGQSLMLIKAPVKRRKKENEKIVVGYTHIVPVNVYNWLKFKSGRTKETEFRRESIVSDPDKPKTQEEVPFGLLIFAVCIGEKVTRNKGERRYETIGKLLSKAFAFHLDAYLKKDFLEQKIIPAVFQTMNPDVQDKMGKHATNSKEFSKEHARIMCIEIFNPGAQNVASPESFASLRNDAAEDRRLASKDRDQAVLDHNQYGRDHAQAVTDHGQVLEFLESKKKNS